MKLISDSPTMAKPTKVTISHDPETWLQATEIIREKMQHGVFEDGGHGKIMDEERHNRWAIGDTQLIGFYDWVLRQFKGKGVDFADLRRQNDEWQQLEGVDL